ncbi:D-glycerate dehydrogenase [Paenibacillaceae bacterium]|nr:D-glycerate dehydrogenase [Paenibacillaceae bacterium]
MKPKVYITRLLPENIVAKISAVCDVSMWQEEDTPVPYDVLTEAVRDVDGLLCLLTDQIDANLIDQAANLKIISTLAVGFNNIDIEAAAGKGIIVSNTPDVLTETTADLTFALMLASARRIVEASDFTRQGKWKTWSPMLLAGQDIYGASLGIIGMGRIGEALVRRAQAFNMKVSYYNRSRKPETEQSLSIEYKDLNTLLGESDFVALMLPYTPETHHLIDRPQLAGMKQSAILINSARGGIVNEAALYDALVAGQIWAAGLDVFEQEPVPVDHPLLTLPNVTVLPHIGSASINTRMKMGDMAAEHLLDGLAGKEPRYTVKPRAAE